MAGQGDFQAAIDLFSDWRWRLDNLYFITDKEGRETQFRMNWAQEALFEEMHYQNVILKARQLGFTTFLQLFMLDACVFNTNVRAGTIAHTLGDAQVIFRDKVKFPYDRLPDGIKQAVPIVHSNATELMLGNNSSIRVGTSLRSGTLQYLHISEYGKICAKFPEKAREVRTGALNTVQSGQIVFIESTAEGQEGHFYEISQQAQSKARSGSHLTPLDFKFHFFPWWKEPAYQIDPEGVVIDDELARYFAKLVELGIELSDGQKAWYAKKLETQQEDMKREFPSTPEEAFEASVEGAYYARQIAKAEAQQRIGDFKAEPGIPVETAWDIGYGDYTAIWFFQRLPGRFRFVGFYQNSGEGLPFYVKKLVELGRERGWKYGRHYWPHDGGVTEWGTGLTRYEQAKQAGLNVSIVALSGIEEGINAGRELFGSCEFDEAGCSEGLRCLRNYRKDWDEDRGVWKDKPRHDWASHGADAFRTFAGRYKEIPAPEPKPEPKKDLVYEAGPDGSVSSNMTTRELIDYLKRKKRRNG